MTTNKNISFEKALADLEKAVGKLESGELTLDDSLAEFERAIALVRLCEGKLNDAKQKVKILIESADGTMTDTDFVGEAGDEA